MACRFMGPSTGATTNQHWCKQILAVLACRLDSHSCQRAVLLWFSLLMGNTEIQGSLIHAQELTDAIVPIKLPILVHHLQGGCYHNELYLQDIKNDNVESICCI